MPASGASGRAEDSDAAGRRVAPDIVAQRELGVTHLALEASSHGLDPFRLDGVQFSAAAFTNLSRDHLDYHGTEEAYLAAKMRLFRNLLPIDGAAVLNADSPHFETVAEICLSAGAKNSDSTGVGQRNDFLVIHVRCVHEAPVVPHIEIFE